MCRSAAGQAVPPGDTTEHRLANGMQVVVKPDRRAPVVVVMVWYRVGSIDEVNGRTGVAHVLEHMMFKGTRTTAVGEYSRIIAAAGGRDNAFTGNDYTGYFAVLQKSHLELAMRLEADRMVNLTLSPEEWAKELRVVMEERTLPDRRPAAFAGLRADDGDGPDRASVPQSGHRLDERPAEHDRRRRPRVLSALVHTEQRGAGRSG
jgi:predicted Zn-dependent peptidase